MPDMEKVIKGLEHCSEDGCDGCPYEPDCLMADGFELARDALELLKEQETIFEKDGHHIRCAHCNSYWCSTDREGNAFPTNYCPECGKAVKLDD